ncbi:MAG: hypothetical protein J6A17_03530 [Bacilli bacterium]|nr:hypothetical protein [Bacilli bacterium]
MRDSFKLENNNKKKNNKQNSNLLILIVCGLIAVVCFGSYFIMNHINKEVVYVEKKDSSKEYVYTIKKEENTFDEGTYYEVPSINLNGEQIDKINESILNKYDEVSKNSEYDYSYEFNKSDNILAVKVTYAYYPNKNARYPIRYFDTYNIDLVDGKVLTDEEILDLYDVSSKEVNLFLKSKFKKYYTDLVNNKFYTERQCNYKCFLKNRGISDNYVNSTSYYIDKGSLTAFKYFYIYSDYEEEKYFKNTNYQFIIIE